MLLSVLQKDEVDGMEEALRLRLLMTRMLQMMLVLMVMVLVVGRLLRR